VLGHSLGGVIAYEAALRAGDARRGPTGPPCPPRGPLARSGSWRMLRI
jgi:hypothetical protein